jgi:hypothetical protein
MPHLRLTLPTLAILLSSNLSAAGRDLAPQRLDAPIGGVVSAATISDGSTALWLWTVESFRAGKHVYGAITEASGSLRVPAMTVMPYIDQYGIGVTTAPGGYFLYRGDAGGVQQRTFSNDGELGTPVRVAAMHDDRSFAPPPAEATRMRAVQEGPRIAASGNGFLAVWTERGGTSQSIVARPLDRDGNPIGAPLELTRVAGSLGDHNVAFGAGGDTLGVGQYLVIWQNGSQILGSRVAAGGAAIDLAPFLIATIHGASRFGIASDGNDFLVTWADGPAVYGTVVTADARVAAALTLIPADEQFQFGEPVVAFDGTRYVVASVANVSPSFPCGGCSFDNRVKAIRVGRDGAPLEASPTTLATGPDSGHLGIASSGRDVLVTFVSRGTVFAATLHADNTLRADLPVPLFQWFDLLSPSVTWNGGAYEVAFRYPSAGWDFDGTGEWYLGAMRLGADGSRGPLVTTITGPPRELDVEPPGLSSTSAGDIAVAVSEARAQGQMPRAVGYTLADLQPATTPPSPSLTWQQSIDGKKLVVSWPDVWNDERGFLLTLHTKHVQPLPLRVPPGATIVSLPWSADLVAVELLVWSEGGFASTKVAIVPPRTRAARH